MAFQFPFTDPVALHLGPVSIRWYGLAYMTGILLGWLYMRRLCQDDKLWGKRCPILPEQVDDFLIWATVGIVLGGRLGFFLFYEPNLFFSNPLRFFKLWEGGMAFHGGLIGVSTAIYLFARRNGIPFLSMADLTAAGVPFGLFFGRLANFVNAEIYGRLTDVSWAVVFPQNAMQPGDIAGPRHPTQIYEAFFEGFVMFLILRYFTHHRLSFRSPGLTVGVFLIAYGLFRIFVEYFKEWDINEFFTTRYFSEGVIYCLPMIMLGMYFIYAARLKHKKSGIYERDSLVS